MNARKCLLVVLVALAHVSAHAYQLRVHGVVTEYLTGSVIPEATVKVYKDGVKVHTEQTGLLGLYAYTLENNARYVLRFTAPGHQTKCFTVDTHGLEWEGGQKTKDVFVEMTLFERIADMDLSFFDLPMGQARFEPATGLLSWDDAYDQRIREQVQSIMSEYERGMTATADASPTALSTGAVRRTHKGQVR